MSLAFRAFYALPEDLQTTDGTYTNAVYGFTSMLIKVLQDEKPDYIATCFDLGEPLKRTEEFSDYKATRTEAPVDVRPADPADPRGPQGHGDSDLRDGGATRRTTSSPISLTTRRTGTSTCGSSRATATSSSV